jgi:hypothetical protein
MIQPIRGGLNSIIMCQLMVMMLVRPLFAVVTTSILDPAAFQGTDPSEPYSSPHKSFWMSALDCSRQLTFLPREIGKPLPTYQD